MQRLYTVAEANALLPKVIPVLEELRDSSVTLRAVLATIAAQRRGTRGDGALIADAWDKGVIYRETEPLESSVEAAESQLETWGIELKDPERGLIDFYHERGGELVLLCFLLGEESVAHWHTLEGGFAGRQPL